MCLQVVRLKRHRDRLMRDQQELSRELAETRLELQGAQHKATEATVRAAGLSSAETSMHASTAQQSVPP
jgi:hypothetical protein